MEVYVKTESIDEEFNQETNQITFEIFPDNVNFNIVKDEKTNIQFGSLNEDGIPLPNYKQEIIEDFSDDDNREPNDNSEYNDYVEPENEYNDTNLLIEKYSQIENTNKSHQTAQTNIYLNKYDSTKKIHHTNITETKNKVNINELNQLQKTETKIYFCEICNQNFINNIQLVAHKLIHCENNFSCDSQIHKKFEIEKSNVCNNIDKTNNQLSSDGNNKKIFSKEDEQSGATKIYICDTCNKAFSEEKQFNDHKLIHKKKFVGIYKKSNNKSHKNIYNNKLFVCKICRLSFKRKITYNIHVRSHKKINYPKNNLGNRKHQMELRKKLNSTENCSRLKVYKQKKKYTCQICNVNFRTKIILMSHRRDHVVNKSPICNICQLEFTNYKDLTQHKRTHKFTCKICEKIFSSKYDLTKHMCVHTSTKTYVCEKCEKTFDSLKKLKIHTFSQIWNCDCGKEFLCCINFKYHKCVKNYVCNLCYKKFVNYGSFKNHIASHVSEKIHKCTKCDAKFYTIYYLRKHERYHKLKGLKKTDETFICEECGKKFITKYGFNIHQIKHKGLPYLCDICNKGFTTSSRLKYHKIIHSGNKQFECDICTKVFFRKFNLLIHKRVHTGIKLYSCHICNKSFTHSGTLKSHIRTHTKEKPFKCDSCFATFTQKSSLNFHKKNNVCKDKSEIIKKYVCQTCGKNFNKNSNLTVHTRLHTGIRPYVCDCGKKFISSSALHKHKRSHGKNGQIICDLCEKVCLTYKELAEHKREHKNNFICTICDQKFAKNSYLKNHIKHIHKLPPYSCIKCIEGFTNFHDLKSHFCASNKLIICPFCKENFTNEAFENHKCSNNLEFNKKICVNIQNMLCSGCDVQFKEITDFESHNCSNNQIKTKSSISIAKSSHLSDEKVSKNVDLNNVKSKLVCSTLNEKFTQNDTFLSHQESHEMIRSTEVEQLFDEHFLLKYTPTKNDSINIEESKTNKKCKKIKSNEPKEPKCFTCPVCNKIFAHNNSLTVHKRTHTGERPYVCDKCSKTFISSCKLNLHKRIHMTDKGFICNICNQGFTTNSSLTRHKNVHTGLKPYACNICNKNFFCSSTLAKHKKIHARKD